MASLVLRLRGAVAGARWMGVRRGLAAPPAQEQVFSGASVGYIESLYEDWKADPNSVHVSMRAYFESMEAGNESSYVSPPALSSVKSSVRTNADGNGSPAKILDVMNTMRFTRAYQQIGHKLANLDPLGIYQADLDDVVPDELGLKYHSLSDEMLDEQLGIFPTNLSSTPGPHKLGEIKQRLEEVYTSNIGWDFMHIQEADRCDWLREKIETPFGGYNVDTQKFLLTELIKSTGFEQFLQKRYGTEKRFGVDGCEVLIPGMNRMIQRSAELGVEIAVLGMPHRGRLNVLHNVLQKPMEAIFNEFAGTAANDLGSGDVKYHLGMSSDVDVPSVGRSMHLSLLANPSHLEAVNPVVAGKTRAEQFYRGMLGQQKVMPVLLHGDAAFAGQGIVYETMGFTELPAYSTGGTLHIVVNNQVGFTTDPRHSRSTPYCTDIAKAVGAPIFHVNGDDVEAVARCFDVAVEWRQTFGSDVVIDIVCYRRHGHNETDQPLFTQPLMYKRIAQQEKTLTKYSQQLVESNSVTQEWVDEAIKSQDEAFAAAFEAAKTFDGDTSDELSSFWSGMKKRVSHAQIANTGVDRATLDHIAATFSTVPDSITVHPALKRTLKQRKQMVEGDGGVDWATGEALAFGSLLLEGNHVRLSGQDVERGTFTHRHHVVHCQVNDGVTYTPLQHLSDDQAEYTVCNSHLSEYGVLGFELGFSMANPHALVCWEAQFGDFANTAQCIIDQFISSGETKWGRQSGLVMLLPHGYEGMGPEHSSARLERFLQMSDDDEDVYPEMDEFARTQIETGNWQVINCTTPANIFHALRRQVHRPFRKPLVVMTPKSLLRHPKAKSPLSAFEEGTRFSRVYPEQDPAVWAGASDGADPRDPGYENSSVRKLIFCTGKVYYDLLEAREEAGITDVAIARVEQLSPFPFDLVHKHADNFPNAEIVWCQEEPRNMGAWTYVAPRIETALRHSTHHGDERATYIGRAPGASTATGDKTIHKREVKALKASAMA